MPPANFVARVPSWTQSCPQVTAALCLKHPLVRTCNNVSWFADASGIDLQDVADFIHYLAEQHPLSWK